MVLRLIWPAMAPNRVKTGPSGAKSHFLSIGRAEIQQGCQRWAENFGDLGRVGSGPGGFFGFFPEWPQLVPNGLGTIIWGPGGPWDYYLGVWGGGGVNKAPIYWTPKTGPVYPVGSGLASVAFRI